MASCHRGRTSGPREVVFVPYGVPFRSRCYALRRQALTLSGRPRAGPLRPAVMLNGKARALAKHCVPAREECTSRIRSDAVLSLLFGRDDCARSKLLRGSRHIPALRPQLGANELALEVITCLSQTKLSRLTISRARRLNSCDRVRTLEAILCGAWETSSAPSTHKSYRYCARETELRFLRILLTAARTVHRLLHRWRDAWYRTDAGGERSRRANASQQSARPRYEMAPIHRAP